MKSIIVLVALFFSSFTFAQDRTYFAVPLHGLEKMDPHNRPATLDQLDGFALVQMTPDEAEELSSAIHKADNVCAGFIGITPSAFQGVNPPTASENFRNLVKSLTTPKRNYFAFAGFDAPKFATEVDLVMKQLTSTSFTKYLTELTALGSRNSRTNKGIAATDYINTKVQEIIQASGRKNITVRKIPTFSPYAMDSVVVKFAGADSKLPAVGIGGHLDSISPQAPGNEPGTDDDGTGSSTTLEVLKAVAMSTVNFQRDVYFMFYAAEEYGLFGSQRVAEEFGKDGIAMLAVAQFDMTGFKSPNDTKEIYFVGDYTDPALTKYLKLLATTYAGLTAAQLGDTLCNYACSDHASWTAAGIPSAIPFESSFGNDNKKIHTPNDTMAEINIPHAMYFVKLAAAFVTEAAQPVGGGAGGGGSGNPGGPGGGGGAGGEGTQSTSQSSFGGGGAKMATGCGRVATNISSMSQTEHLVLLLLFMLPLIVVAVMRFQPPSRKMKLAPSALAVGLLCCVLFYQNCSSVSKESQTAVEKQLPKQDFIPKSIYNR